MDATDTPLPVVIPHPVVRAAKPDPAPPPPAFAPVASVTYLLTGGRIVVVPAGQPLPAGLFAPVPQVMPTWCPPWQPR